jgi:hypothetical protein
MGPRGVDVGHLSTAPPRQELNFIGQPGHSLEPVNDVRNLLIRVAILVEKVLFTPSLFQMGRECLVSFPSQAPTHLEG